MMKRYVYILILIIASNVLFSQKTQTVITKIAFGSCGDQSKPQPILNLVTKYSPDIFLYLGDNIYADTKDMGELKAKYDMLGAKPEFKKLKASTKILATWDDHDFGWNDVGRHYPFKEKSKELFMNFFEEDSASIRRQHEGIYNSYAYGPRGKRVQIILLDTRTFRDNLRPYAGELKNDSRYFYELDYTPEISKDSTLLGAAQWKWLEEQLNMPADIRIIGSSTQFGVEFNGYESWANFPNEQKKMLDLIDKTQAGGVIFLSGDVHYSEMSRIKRDGTYPIYDFTSSGITSTWHFATPNKNRIEGPVMENHFGLMTINWNPGQTTIKMECIDVHNNQRFEYNIPLNSIQPGLE